MPAVRGSHRWIPLPFFQVQTSEFGKMLLIAALAAFAVDRSRRLHERRTTARIMLLALLPAMIVIPQPDLGTGLVYVAVAFAVLFFAGTSWKQLAALVAIFAAAVAIVLAAAPAVGVHVLKPYQVQRLTGFLNPSRDPANQTYNIGAIADRHRLRRQDRAGGGPRHSDQPAFPPGEPDGLHLCRRRRDLWLRRGGARAIAICITDMAKLANPDHGQEPLRHPDCRRHPCHADVPGVRERGYDDRNHADHRSARSR